VPDDGASQVAAELIALERRRLSGSNSKEVAGIQSIVAQELEQFAVELAATRASSQVDNRSRALALILGRYRVNARYSHGG